MFPVKGLAVSAEKLRTEGAAKTSAPAAAGGDPAAPAPKNKKRKRAGRPSHQEVTAANLSDLWDKIVAPKDEDGADGKAEKKPRKEKKRKTDHESSSKPEPAEPQAEDKGPVQSGSKKQKQKQQKDLSSKPEGKKVSAEAEKPAEDDDEEWGGLDDDEPSPEAAPKPAREKKSKKDKKDKKAPDSKDDQKKEPPSTEKPKEQQLIKPTPAPGPKLTPLQASMRQKLVSARFRHLNETLYTRPSKDMFQMFSDSPEMFSEYHEGFRRQVDVWPENPVDGYISLIQSRAKVRFPPRNPPTGSSPLSSYPLLRDNNHMCSIADLGCGDAALSSALQSVKGKLKLDLRSYDLQDGGNPNIITRADISNLPLANNTVDIAIFCLALMGTNWIDFIEEAYRVLRWKGELWVAEIKSRFAQPTNKRKVVEHSVGNRRKPGAAGTSAGGKKKNAKLAEEEEKEEEEMLAVEVDGQEYSAKKGETDVSAFVEALRKRGFVLNRDAGEECVDMHNKMFVKMYFVKMAPAQKGKCVVQSHTKNTDGKGNKVIEKRFINKEDSEEDVNERGILKPCVYKLR
ncbi:ribosomal RNA-processing protein 8 [Diplogelasinospora grovesii]|uniref:Ribosomal RNA-processing protein 8 n=1 Tax=Diplogelasinospora grovesii TaxID=303347 RepID=A0AAN6S5I3_9PEZI|nr:ribosomal RNA-processing protein 8 [Diplogelasinospora grovesii]